MPDHHTKVSGKVLIWVSLGLQDGG